MEKNSTLVLPIKGKWFRMILSGEKGEEYRTRKPYWEKRFLKYFGQTMDERKRIIFRNGYGNDKPQFTALCSLSEGYGREEWGAEKGIKYYVLKIHEVTDKRNINTGE